MAKKYSYSYLIFLILGIFILINCKSEKGNTVPHAKESGKTADASFDKNVSQNSSAFEAKDEAIDQETSKISSEVKSKAPEEIEKEAEISKKEVQKPAVAKSSTTSGKNKPIRVNKNKPKIQFEELVWNFGEITEGDVIEKKFKFTNTGNAPLQIIATSATCGCTRPTFPFLDIAPGESDVIGITYNSVGKDGKQNPEITVESNTDPKITIIKLHGVVTPKPKVDK